MNNYIFRELALHWSSVLEYASRHMPTISGWHRYFSRKQGADLLDLLQRTSRIYYGYLNPQNSPRRWQALCPHPGCGHFKQIMFAFRHGQACCMT